MDSRLRAGPEQMRTLLEYMESHGDLARPLSGAQGRLRSDQLWAELTLSLNAAGGGVNKTTEKWKKVWADWKSKTKKKALLIRNHGRVTGGGPACKLALSSFEERVLAIMGPLAVEGQASIPELGFNRSQPCLQDPPSLPPLAEDVEIILNETLQLAPSPSLLMPSTSLEDATPHSPPMVAMPSSDGQQSALRATPAVPSTPVHIDYPSSSPPTRRRPRVRTPATPQSEASPSRARLRARRRRAPTPFERAASEFAAVELRRLELEETRLRQQHERDMRALEVDRERTEVLRGLVDAAQDWLDYFRSRDNH